MLSALTRLCTAVLLRINGRFLPCGVEKTLTYHNKTANALPLNERAFFVTDFKTKTTKRKGT
jgi:hypothetical protein